MLSLVLLVGLLACKSSNKTNDKLEIAKTYYEALDRSDASAITEVLSDSLVTAIPTYDYQVSFSKNDYVEKWLKWDSVFEPSYQLLEMEMDKGTVKAKVSKTDKRIHFMMHKPFLTQEILRFKNNKIATIETEYLNFDEESWEKNKSGLLSWIEANHPELNGFIYDQTEAGGKKFLKAIELYENRK